MKAHVHDFSGHPFQVQLSRELARRGHAVRHSYCDTYVGGKGALSVGPEDPDTLRIAPVPSRAAMDKYHPVRRARFELTFARDLYRELTADRPDVVVLCNVPLLAMWTVSVALRRRGVPFVFWHQDIYSMGMADELARTLPGAVAAPLGTVFRRMERACVRDAAGVVAIDDVFAGAYREWGLDTAHVQIVPNWAPLDRIRPRDRDGGWAREHGLPTGALRLLYSGTLGRKHNPLLLRDLVRELVAAGRDVHLTVVSEGDGADALRAGLDGRDPVTMLPFQPAEQLSDVLASADALLALLEPEASRFSIPSKVLSYLAAGRPVAGLMPADNAAAAAIRSVGGTTAAPDDAGVADAARWLGELADDPARGQAIGAEARAYAEREFDLETIGGRFEDVLTRCARTPEPAPR